jgi:ammonia channel protein AmtB
METESAARGPCCYLTPTGAKRLMSPKSFWLCSGFVAPLMMVTPAYLFWEGEQLSAVIIALISAVIVVGLYGLAWSSVRPSGET